MPTTTVRISKKARDQLREMSAETGLSMADVLAKAVDHLERELFFEQVEEDYRALRSDPVPWQEYLQDRRELDGSLMDGLDDEATEDVDQAECVEE